MKSKRLFLVAGYSAQNKVDAALIYMVKSLSDLGDVILVMDSDVPKSELDKISNYVIYSDAVRHFEYDFGSYKRAYVYAKENGLLNNYEYLYIINDSVYGPVHPLDISLNKMESFGTDSFGLVYNPHKKNPHIQSWFIGFKPSIFLSDWFNKFMVSITRQPSKGVITYVYEQGLSKLIREHNGTIQCIYSAPGRSVYNDIKKLYDAGMPFIKKVAFTRHGGALGSQLCYVLNKTDPITKNAITSAAKETFGERYINWLLTRNPVKIFLRNAKYFIHKIFTEGL